MTPEIGTEGGPLDRSPLRKIIAYGLWGTDPMYTQGAIDNARIAQKLYPDWTCRFYLGASVPSDVVEELRAQPNVETQEVDEPEDLRAAFWRFRAAQDADVLLCRDTDGRLSRAEAAAVRAWLESDKEAHALAINRLRLIHSLDILAGLFGVRGQALRDLHREASSYRPDGSYGDDEIFLRERLKPLLLQRDALLMHDPTWGWGEPPPLPPADAFATRWYHEPEIHLQALPRERGASWFMGMVKPPRKGWQWRLLGRGVRRIHKGMGQKLVLRGVVLCPGRWQRRTRRWTGRPQMADRMTPEDILAVRQSMAAVPGPENGVIALALPSNDPALLRGALDNARAAAAFYPEWQCRFHVHPALDTETREALESMPGVVVQTVDADAQRQDPSLWGLQAAGDCDALLLRSPLARLSLYDRQAVYHWLASGCELHSLHDHPRHGWRRPTPDLAGLRGEALAWAAGRPGHADPLGALARQARKGQMGWLRHDNIWHIGTPLPDPCTEPMLGYHGMPWELSEEYGGLPAPVLEDYRRREACWEGTRFLVTSFAARTLRSLHWKRDPAERLMALLCGLLYPKQKP